jgi:hypothetical protein
MTAKSNTGGVKGGKSISSVSTVKTLVAFYDSHGRKGEALFFCSVPDITLDDF